MTSRKAAHRDHALAGDAGAEARRLEKAMTGAGFQPLPTQVVAFRRIGLRKLRVIGRTALLSF
jgi:hypothetical protein